MTEHRISAAFAELDTKLPDAGIDLDRLHRDMARAHQRRAGRRGAAVLGAGGLIAVIVLVLVPLHGTHDELVPGATESATPSPGRLGPLQGRIAWLPKGMGVLDLPDMFGSTHLDYFRLPNVRTPAQHLNPAQMLVFAATPTPRTPPGDDRTGGIPVTLANNHATYYGPAGPFHVAVFTWSDGLFNYRLQAPIRQAITSIGLSYEDFRHVANSVPRATQPALVASPQPTPSGEMDSPEPGVHTYWSPFMYATDAPTTSAPAVTAPQALATARSRSALGAHSGQTPEEYLAIFTKISPDVRRQSLSVYSRLAWVIRFGGTTTTDPATGKDYQGCTDSYVVDATSGQPLLDSQDCPRP